MINQVAAKAATLPVYHTKSPSIVDDGDQSIIDIIPEEVAIFNQVDHDDQQRIIMAAPPSSELSVFQKSELSKGMLGFVVTILMGLFICLVSYSDDESKIPKAFIYFVLSILLIGATLIIIGIIVREMIVSIARVLEVVGFLLVLLGVFGLASSMMPKVLIWVTWICYINIFIALLLDLFPKLAARIFIALLLDLFRKLAARIRLTPIS